MCPAFCRLGTMLFIVNQISLLFAFVCVSVVYEAKGMKFCTRVPRTCVHKRSVLDFSFICLNRILDA